MEICENCGVQDNLLMLPDGREVCEQCYEEYEQELNNP